MLLGLVFSAGIYLLATSLRDGWQANKEDALPMMLSLYGTLGVFLLVGARNPLENRSVMAFAAPGRVLRMAQWLSSCALPSEESNRKNVEGRGKCEPCSGSFLWCRVHHRRKGLATLQATCL